MCQFSKRLFCFEAKKHVRPGRKGQHINSPAQAGNDLQAFRPLVKLFILHKLRVFTVNPLHLDQYNKLAFSTPEQGFREACLPFFSLRLAYA
jgi:hypothetical protein